MIFSPKQEAALSAVNRWFKKPSTPIFRVFGYAGTGKTTLAKHFAEGIKGSVCYAAFTGKAAMVMRQNGCAGASTIHSLIYKPDGDDDEDRPGRDDNPRFKLNFNGKLDKAKLLIIDECSMVDEEIGKDLLKFNVPILVLGDPGQLPPVAGGGFFTAQEPDILLDEIHRQAGDNPIIRIATDVREGRGIKLGDYGKVRIIDRGDVTAALVTGADQVLVGKNITRQKYNNRLRELAGFRDALPMFGDRLVALRNEREKGILNGGLWTVVSVSKPLVKSPDLLRMEVKSLDFDDGEPIKVKVRRELFTNPGQKIEYSALRGTQQFDYGYALTVHKSQGSQWQNVCLFDESRTFGADGKRHLYTGITRAADTLTIVRS